MTTFEISGATRLYALLGDPVHQVRAPGLLNPLLAARGVDAVVVPVHATAENLVDVVRGLQRMGNVDGLLITVPHKAAICELADELGPAAALSGSANAMRRTADGRWVAENFDGLGFVRGLELAGHPVRGAHVMLVGAGGAGSAIAAALLTAGIGRLSLYDVDPARLPPLLARLAPRWPGRLMVGLDDLPAADFVVNATPLGLRPDDPLPFEPRAVRADAVVVDIIMKPRETALLRTAAGLGLAIHHGIHMLEQQTSYYTEFFGWPSGQTVPVPASRRPRGAPRMSA